MRKSSARASHLVLLGPASRPQATPGRSGHPLPTFGPPAPVKLKDYNSRQALRSRCCGFIDQALQGLMGVGVLSASPGCREDGNFFGRWGGGGGYEMPGSQGAAGERNNVWDLEKPRSPKSRGAMEWVNHPHARGIGGRGWGAPRCFGTPPSRTTCPSPGAAWRRCSTPTPGSEIRAPLPRPAPPCARAAPGDGAGAGALAGGGGGADSPGAAPAAAAAAAAAATAPRAGRGASSAPPPAPVAGPRLLPSHPLLLPLRTCGFLAEIAPSRRAPVGM